MALNVLQEAEKAYESLTDRLKKYDTYVGKYDPTAGGAPSFAGRPAGFNPVDTLRDAESLSMTLGRNRGDIESERLAALDRIAKLQPESSAMSEKDRLSLEMQAAEKGMELYRKDDGSLGVRPATVADQTFDASREAKLIIGGNKKLSDVPVSMRPTVEKAILEEGNKEKIGLASLVKELYDADTTGMTGFSQIRSMFPGTGTQKSVNKYDQLKSFLSLENRQKLKGSGAISDFEARTLEKAASALGRNLSDTDFENELKNIYKALTGEELSAGVNPQEKIDDIVSKYWEK